MASFTFPLMLHAEKEAPKIIKDSEQVKETHEQNSVPVALQQQSPEVGSSNTAPIRNPSAVDESYKSQISHSLEPMNSEEYKEFLKSFENGDKTSAPIKE